MQSSVIPSLLLTKDGSHTLFNSQLNECYHSTNGARQESLHVFIEAGLKHFVDNNTPQKSIQIVELGFGTGLNAILSYVFCKNKHIACSYTGIEAYPIDILLAAKLNYTDWMSDEDKAIFSQLHSCQWDEKIELSHIFSLHKCHIRIEDYFNPSESQKYDIVYMDAFDPAKQAELWTEDLFKQIHNNMNEGGIIVTYSSKGDVKRAMRAAGFIIERLPGPVGKRHMIRGRKKTEF